MIMTANNSASSNADIRLYRALAMGDVPAAYLISASINKTGTYSGENPATAFNRGLCLFLLEEYESALTELKRAEQLAGNPPELDISDKKLFTKAIENANRGQKLCSLPLDPDQGKDCLRYALVRIKWLTALCLKELKRDSEAAMIKRFLSQYNIEI